MKKFHIVTYGCQMNIYDSDLVAGILEKEGWHSTANPLEANLILVNTCSVRQTAENRAMGRLREFSGIAKNNPNQYVGVMGCMAQRLKDELFDQIKGLDFIIGTDQLTELKDIIQNIDKSHRCLVGPSGFTGDGFHAITPDSSSAFVAISRGCSNFCSYCIVPYVRGPLRSRSIDDIILEIEAHVRNGVKEITLLGQNVNSYDYNSIEFPDLLARVTEVDDLLRVRFTSNNPKDLSDRLITLMNNNVKVANSIHLPVQSGSDRILKLMKRRYTVESYLEMVAKLKQTVPYIAITSDILVGYPGETEEDYQATLDIIREVGYAGLFSFKYSVRPGTESSKLEDNVPEKEKLRRLDTVIDLGQKLAHDFSKLLVSLVQNVLVESIFSKNKNKLRGRSGNGRIVEFEGSPEKIGSVVNVQIESCTTWTLMGREIE